MRVCIRARPLSLPRDARVDGCGPRLALTATTRLALGGGTGGFSGPVLLKAPRSEGFGTP